MDLGNDWSLRCVISCKETIITFSVTYHSNIAFERVKRQTFALIIYQVSYNFRFPDSRLKFDFTLAYIIFFALKPSNKNELVFVLRLQHSFIIQSITT